MNEYLAPWSSTMCPYHKRQIRQNRAKSAARRLTRGRAAAATRPVITVLQAEEVQG